MLSCTQPSFGVQYIIEPSFGARVGLPVTLTDYICPAFSVMTTPLHDCPLYTFVHCCMPSRPEAAVLSKYEAAVPSRSDEADLFWTEAIPVPPPLPSSSEV